MELTMTMGAFEALDQQELFAVDGGTKETAAAIMIFGGAVVAGFLAPLTCGGSLAVYATVAVAGYTAMWTGVSMLY